MVGKLEEGCRASGKGWGEEIGAKQQENKPPKRKLETLRQVLPAALSCLYSPRQKNLLLLWDPKRKNLIVIIIIIATTIKSGPN